MFVCCDVLRDVLFHDRARQISQTAEREDVLVTRPRNNRYPRRQDEDKSIAA